MLDGFIPAAYLPLARRVSSVRFDLNDYDICSLCENDFASADTPYCDRCARPMLAVNLFGENRTPPWAEPGQHRRMTGAEYAAYLLTPVWLEKRKAVMYRCKYWCEWIGCSDRAVNVHHLTYANVGHEPLTDLIAVCRRHHGNAHYDSTRPWKGPAPSAPTLFSGARLGNVHQAPKKPPTHIMYERAMREKTPA
jgi:hypothetical protein